MKTFLGITGIIVLGIIAIVCAMALARSCAPEPQAPQPAIPAPTTVYITQAPAQVTTEIVDGEPHEIARLDTIVTTPTAVVDLGIQYDESANNFDLIRLYAQPSAVVAQVPALPRPKLLRLTAGLGIGLGSGEHGTELRSADVEAGVLLREQYRLTLWADTRQTFGIRAGVDF
jgi:hypothetical protein